MSHTVDEEDNNPWCSFTPIDVLQHHGVGVADITKLKSAKIFTIGMAGSTTKRKMQSIKGLSELKADKIHEAITKASPPSIGGFVTALELKQTRKKVFHISTGCKAFDAMLGGGISSGSVTQVFGEYRCGKTQLSHTVCVIAQLPKDMGGAEGKVAFVDTEGTFRPERIGQIADRFGLDPDTALDNISYARCADTETQMNLVENLSELFLSGEYRLLIIDSIIALFRVEFLGRGELAERQQMLGKLLHHCTKLASEFNICVFVTNQVQSDPGASSLFATGPKAVGGNIMNHSCATIVALRKGRGEERVAKVVDSPDVPEGDCVYVIGPGGITDSDGK